MIDLMINTGDTGSMDTETEEGPESIKVTTIHSAKGLEFKYIFVVNLVDKRFPTIERRDPIELPEKLIKEIIPEGDIHIQEERRLFYVALTRAKRGLYLTSAEDYGGKTSKRLSQFFYELELETQKDIIRSEKIKKIREKDISLKPINKKLKISIPSRFSFSQFAAYQNCPLQYKYAFVLRIPCQGKAVFSFGKTLHNTLYQFCRKWRSEEKIQQKNLFNKKEEKNKEGKVSINDLMSIYQQSWVDDWYEDKEQKDKYWEKGKKALKNFYEDFTKSPKAIKYLEKEFNFKIDVPNKNKEENKYYIIKGVIDRVDETDQGYEIIDYKTGKNAGKILNADKKQQLLIYQLAVGETKDLKKVEEDIVKIIENIQKQNFIPKPGYLCQYCDFFHICPYRKE